MQKFKPTYSFSAAWADQGAMEELYMMCLLLRTVGVISGPAAEKQ